LSTRLGGLVRSNEVPKNSIFELRGGYSPRPWRSASLSRFQESWRVVLVDNNYGPVRVHCINWILVLSAEWSCPRNYPLTWRQLLPIHPRQRSRSDSGFGSVVPGRSGRYRSGTHIVQAGIDGLGVPVTRWVSRYSS